MKIDQVKAPDRESVKKYGEIKKIFEQYYSALKDVFEEIYKAG